MNDLSIIIVNWNSTDFLLKCVDSIYEQIHEVAFEIIVVDNASPNGDAKRVKEVHPEVMLIESPANLGFAGANNLGFRASRGEYIVFLNPDTVLINPAFDIMLREVRSLPALGATGCRLLNEDLTVQTSAIQTFPTILNQLLDVDILRNGFPACRLWNIAPLTFASSEPSRVEVISGACVLLRRDVFAQVDNFSEEYFMYAEDLDLCWKVLQAGYLNYYIPLAQIIHYGGKSSVGHQTAVMKWRSILRFVSKYRGSGYELVFRIAIGCSALARVALLIVWMAVVKGEGRRESASRARLKWWLVLRTMISGHWRIGEHKPLTTEKAQGR